MDYLKFHERWTDLLVGPGSGKLSSSQSVLLLDQRIEGILTEHNFGKLIDFDGYVMWNFSKQLRLLAIGVKTCPSKFYGSSDVIDFITNGLVMLNRSGYNSMMVSVGNWWEWTIGIPQTLADILLLLTGKIPQTLETSIQNAINHNIPDPKLNKWARTHGNKSMTSANLLDQIQPLLILAFLNSDQPKISELCAQIKSSAKTVSDGDGLYRDGSFIFHVNNPYNGTYGAVFFSGLLKFSYALYASKFDINESITDFMTHFAARGLVPLIIGKEYAAIVCGRAAHRRSRPSDSLHHILDLLIYNELSDNQIPELRRFSTNFLGRITVGLLDEFAPEQEGSPCAISSWFAYLARFYKQGSIEAASDDDSNSLMTWYPSMLRGIYRSSSGWTLEIALADRNVAYYESSSTENIHGYHSGNGAYWIHPKNGISNPAFAGLHANSIPGSTIDVDIDYKPDRPWSNMSPCNFWAGAIGDGLDHAILTMDMFGYQSNLRARKSWFIHPEFIVYMASNLRGQKKIARSTVFSTSTPELYDFQLISEYAIRIIGWGLIISPDTPLKFDLNRPNGLSREDETATISVETGNNESKFTIIIVPEVSDSSGNILRVILPHTANLTRDGVSVHSVYNESGTNWAVAHGASTFRLAGITVSVSRGCIVSLLYTKRSLTVSVSDPADENSELILNLEHELSDLPTQKTLYFTSVGSATIVRTLY